MAKKEIDSRKDIDKKEAVLIARNILGSFDGLPLEKSLTVMNAITIALVKFVADVRKQVEVSEDDGLEKLVLSWFSATDVITGNVFSKFVSTDCVQLDIDDIWKEQR